MAHNWHETDRWLIGEAWAGSRIGQHTTELCSHIGPRWGSSPGDRNAADYIRSQMQSFGLAAAGVEQFNIHTWEHGKAEAIVTANGQSVPILPFNRTPPVDVTGPVVDIGYGTAREVGAAARSLKGAIAVMTMAHEPFTPLITHADRLKLVAKAGAAACICVDRKSGGRVEYHSASDWRDPGMDEHPVPTVGTSREGGAALRHVAADGGSLSLVVESRFYDAPAWNTVADLPGALWPQEHLVLGGHHDTVHGSPGGNDNGSGTIAVLETARVLAALAQATGVRPGRTIRFATWSGEEQKLQGSAAYVRAHYAGEAFKWPDGYGAGDFRAGPEKPPRFALNLDELSTGNVKGVVLNFPHLREFMQRQLESLGEGFKCHVLEHLDPYSDHFPFALAAIDSGFLWRWRFVGKHPDSDYHHEPGDTMDKINVRELKEYVGFLARFLLRLSHVPPGEWPANPETPQRVQARLRTERQSVLRTM
jgi:Zn-dependent M28 family amino/carboxypeptidase